MLYDFFHVQGGQTDSFMQALQLGYAPTHRKICYGVNSLVKHNLFRVVAKHTHCLKQKLLCYLQWNCAKRKYVLNSILRSQGRVQCKHMLVTVPGALRTGINTFSFTNGETRASVLNNLIKILKG